MARPSTFLESRSWQGDDCGKFMSKGFSNPQVYDDRIIIPEDLKGL